jgi:type IV secretion system protein VirB6
MAGAARPAPAAGAVAPQRRIDVAGVRTGAPANDYGSSSAAGTVRETRVYATSSGGGQVGEGSAASSRTRGIGNRFRSASPQRAKGAAATKTETPR